MLTASAIKFNHCFKLHTRKWLTAGHKFTSKNHCRLLNVTVSLLHAHTHTHRCEHTAHCFCLLDIRTGQYYILSQLPQCPRSQPSPTMLSSVPLQILWSWLAFSSSLRASIPHQIPQHSYLLQLGRCQMTGIVFLVTYSTHGVTYTSHEG